MKRAILISAIVLATTACAPAEEVPAAEQKRVLSASGRMITCNDKQLETNWQDALACGDRTYTAGGKDGKIWIDPEFKCEYFLSEYSDGSAIRRGPGAPRMAVINGNYVHVCRA